jgi:hypothetical protein
MWLRRSTSAYHRPGPHAAAREHRDVLCDLLRVRSGFVGDAGRPARPRRIEACGQAVEFLEKLTHDDLSVLTGGDEMPVMEGYRVHALSPSGSTGTLGLLALDDPGRVLSADEAASTRSLLASAERALEDRVVQSRVLGSLRDRFGAVGLQRLRGRWNRYPPAWRYRVQPDLCPDFPIG